MDLKTISSRFPVCAVSCHARRRSNDSGTCGHEELDKLSMPAFYRPFYNFIRARRSDGVAATFGIYECNEPYTSESNGPDKARESCIRWQILRTMWTKVADATSSRVEPLVSCRVQKLLQDADFAVCRNGSCLPSTSQSSPHRTATPSIPMPRLCFEVPSCLLFETNLLTKFCRHEGGKPSRNIHLGSCHKQAALQHLPHLVPELPQQMRLPGVT